MIVSIGYFESAIPLVICICIAYYIPQSFCARIHFLYNVQHGGVARSTVGEINFYFEMNRIWLLSCPLLPRMHLARSSLNGPQKPYDPVVFLHTAGDAKKARHHLARMTETCNQLMSPHVKCKSDLLPTGHI
jgi:hypothetical protein